MAIFARSIYAKKHMKNTINPTASRMGRHESKILARFFLIYKLIIPYASFGFQFFENLSKLEKQPAMLDSNEAPYTPQKKF